MKTPTLLLLTMAWTGFCNAQYNTASGIVYDCYGNPVANQPVYVYMNESASFTQNQLVYTDASGFYTAQVYCAWGPDASPFHVTTFGYNHEAYDAMESPMWVMDSVYTHDFHLACYDPSIVPGTTIYSSVYLTGQVFDCESNPVAGYPVNIDVDPNSGVTHHHTVYSDASGYWRDTLLRTVPDGQLVPFNIHIDPFPGSMLASDFLQVNVHADTLVFSGYLGCDSCYIHFDTEWDSLGTTGNDTVYLDLDYLVSNPSSAVITWDFGDGATATGEINTHVYASGGVYNICVNIVSGDTCNATYCHEIEMVTRSSAHVVKTYRSSYLTGTGPAVETQPDYRLYPNPANEILYISCPAEAHPEYVRISDMSGRQLVLQPVAQSGLLNIDINHLERGTYLVEIYGLNHQRQYTAKVLKD